MRNVQSAMFAMAVMLGMIAAACGGGNGTGAGGSGGGSGGSGGGSACPGGDVVGTWTVSSSSLTIGGNRDLTGLGIGCTTVPVTASLTVSGTWTLNADGTYADNTTTSGTEELSPPAACLDVSGTTITCDRLNGPLEALGYVANSVNCTDASGGGCTCTAMVQQMGWPGIVSSNATMSGNYTTSGNMLTIDSVGRYTYCVSGNMLTVTPQTTNPTTGGMVVFSK